MGGVPDVEMEEVKDAEPIDTNDINIDMEDLTSETVCKSLIQLIIDKSLNVIQENYFLL